MTCQITPDCPNPCEGTTNGCASCNHALRKAEREAAKVKVRKPIKKVSDHRAIELRAYNKEVKVWIVGKTCCVPGCGQRATEVHHSGGKENELLMIKHLWKPMCSSHHKYFTEHSKEAIELGISVLRTSIKLK